MKRKFLTATLCIVAGLIILWTASIIYAALTITASSDTDWTAVAEGAVGESANLDISLSYSTTYQIQAFLNGTDAHEGTEFLIQTSFNTSGDEDWSDYCRFIELVGTANSEQIDDDPLDATDTTILCADTTGYTVDATSMRWVGIEDATLANSELVLQTGLTTNTNITIKDGVTNAHVLHTLMWNIAFSKSITIPMGVGIRARVVVNNNYDADGTASALNYRVRKVLTSVIQ